MLTSLEQTPEKEELCIPKTEQEFYVKDELYMSDENLEDKAD